MGYWRSMRSFLRGADGLTPTQQIDRNLTVAIGNVKFIVACEIVILVLTIVKLATR